jgi:hypothetical protein
MISFSTLLVLLLAFAPACGYRPLGPNRGKQNSDQAALVSRGKILSRDLFLEKIAAFSFFATVARPEEVFAMMTDPKTGIALPSPGEIQDSIPSSWDDVDNPVDESDRSIFSRLDTSPDSVFYKDPRYVEHVDENAVRLMTEYISNQAIKIGDSVLDLCSSWTSHIDPSVASELPQVVGLGMNLEELKANKVLTESTVQDLNDNPTLPYEDASFDVVLCQLSIDYLTRPLEVLNQVGRVLKSGGTVHILFSNRLFLSKVSSTSKLKSADDLAAFSLPSLTAF